MIESIEGQLRGLKTLLAAGNNAAGTHQTVAVPQHDPLAPSRMSEQDELDMERHLGMMRQREIDNMKTAAGTEFQKLWAEDSPTEPTEETN